MACFYIVFFAVSVILISYLNRYRKFPKLNGIYSQQIGVWYHLKAAFLFGLLSIIGLTRRLCRRYHRQWELKRNQLPRDPSRLENNSIVFSGSDKDSAVLSVRFNRHFQHEAEVGVLFRFPDGRLLSNTLPRDCINLIPDETPFGDERDFDYLSAGGLRIRAIDPVRTYRLLYNGLMRLSNDDGGDRYVNVSLRCWFRALTDPVDFDTDFSPRLAAHCLAAENEAELIEMAYRRMVTNKPAIHIEQSGQAHCVVEIEKNKQYDSWLNGLRRVYVGESPIANSQGFFHFRGRLENGLIISLNADSHSGKVSHLLSGFVTYPSGYVYPVTWTDLHLCRIVDSNSNKGNLSTCFSINMTAHDRNFELKFKVLDNQIVPQVDGPKRNVVVVENVVQVNVVQQCRDGVLTGYGIVEFNRRGERTEVSSDDIIQKSDRRALLHNISEPAYPFPVPTCVQLNDRLCRLSSLTGGKAAKLADIIAVTSKVNLLENTLKVPDGFAVTVAAYETFLKESSKELSSEIDSVLNMTSKLSLCSHPQRLQSLTTDLEDACQKLHVLFMETPLPESLERDIEAHMVKTFGDGWMDVFTAVRSSAVGEDGTEASGAGQMETFLGRQGKDKIIEAVKLCWASHYSFRALQYRRQMAAKLDSPMAVLIQQLVDADVAGVLFTRHPDTGSTAETVINACYGIGEGVVSGQVQPDSITVKKVTPTSDSQQVEIVYDHIGEKATAFKLDVGKGEVEAEEIAVVDLDDKPHCCLTDTEIRRLYSAGKAIEAIFGSCRDVEFALKRQDDYIFILQARPITTADMEQEWELIHEFDTPVATESEYITTANVQEMMPGALTPLSGAVWVDVFTDSLERPQTDYWLKPRRRFQISRFITMSYQHVFLNWGLIGIGATNEFSKLSGDMALFGKKMEFLTPETFVELNDMYSKWWLTLLKILDWKNRLLPREGMSRLIEKITSFSQPTTKDPVKLFETIDQMRPFLKDVWYEHVQVSARATMYPMVLMHTMDSSLNWGPQLYEDMATLLSTCTDVFSADVPTQLHGIASSIGQDSDEAEKFLQMDSVQGAEWLLSDKSGKHGQLFRTFLEKHGHRSVRDSDLRQKSWSQEPGKVVDALKVMISSKAPPPNAHGQKRELTVEEAMAAVKTPLGRIQRYVLKMFLPKARIAVGRREWAKSYGIMATDHCRRVYHRLAASLTCQGHLPDEDTIFFLTPNEIKGLLEKRSPKLIAKALRRRKLFAKFSNFQFPEISHGLPQPEVAVKMSQHDCKDGFSIKGIAVGSGCIQGVARVVTSLAEANHIENGDILIVPYTDVGWTPYFPMISGLVTELGGLISHGAVVAREYGLPCLVGCKQATELIKTGDRIYIDGHAGEIRVLSQE